VGYQQGLTRTFLLDTHVWLWTVEGVRDLGRRTARFIERWAEQDALRISPLSVFEIAALHASGRLHLSKSPEHWIALALENTGARLAPLPMEAALEAGAIGTVPDPIDRLLIATVTAEQRRCDLACKGGACFGNAAPVCIAPFACLVRSGRGSGGCHAASNRVAGAQFDFDGRPTARVVDGARRRGVECGHGIAMGRTSAASLR